MRNYNFDEFVNRKGTNSLKYDFAVECGYPENVLPLWVADMDFPTAQPVLDALHKAVHHGIFGYSEVKADYYSAVSKWFSERFSFETKPEWLVKTPGIVFAIAMAIRALTDVGDSVLIQTPVYYPFYSAIEDNNRKLVQNELVYINGHYEIDFDDFESKIKENRVKLFILCSPHNPVGRVWTKDELQKIGEICNRYNVFVVSDEIHCDFTLNGNQHTVFSVACPQMQDKSIICTAPSKTFNLAGLQVSNIWIPDLTARKKILNEIDACGYSQLNSLGLVAAQAAYESGSEWLCQCKTYMQNNLDFLRDFLQKSLPEIKLVEPEGTYFAWLDCSQLGLSYKELNDLIINKAGLWLDAGHIFGKKSAMFQRIVLACTRKTLATALEQLEKAIHNK
ncbi:MAG: pyridoxal phosphate-dependent aminotransferase [Eubacterium sp.]|nr:pyridoxal phosphate-dependent aminotransferase [Eubacterium sp.]